MEDHTRLHVSYQKPVDSNFWSEFYLWETVPKFSASLNNFSFFSEFTCVVHESWYPFSALSVADVVLLQNRVLQNMI